MQYTRLGNTGLIISRLPFGAMTFGSLPDHPMAHVFNTREKTADALVGRSLDAGINFFDTADAYANGQSEQILGKALKPSKTADSTQTNPDSCAAESHELGRVSYSGDSSRNRFTVSTTRAAT